MFNILAFLTGTAGAAEASTDYSVTINTDASCQGLAAVVFYGVYAVKVIRIVVPILLIIWGSIDLLKSIISGDEKKISAARKPFIQRLISAVLVFLLPWLVNAIINFASSDSDKKDGQSEWIDCWQAAWDSKGIGEQRFDPFDDTGKTTTEQSKTN